MCVLLVSLLLIGCFSNPIWLIELFNLIMLIGFNYVIVNKTLAYHHYYHHHYHHPPFLSLLQTYSDSNKTVESCNKQLVYGSLLSPPWRTMSMSRIVLICCSICLSSIPSISSSPVNQRVGGVVTIIDFITIIVFVVVVVTYIFDTNFV